MKFLVWKGLILCFTLCVQSHPVLAQAPQLLEGARVRVWLRPGGLPPMEGVLLQANADSLGVRARGAELAFPMHAVLRIDVSRGESHPGVIRGAGIGSLIGAGVLGLTLLAGWSEDDPGNDYLGISRQENALIGVVLGVALGAPIGGIVGATATVEHWDTVFTASDASP